MMAFGGQAKLKELFSKLMRLDQPDETSVISTSSSRDDEKEQQIELEEERKAKLTGEILRICLTPPGSLTESLDDATNAATTYHYRFCEDQLLRNTVIKYRLSSVELIINPALHKRYQKHKERLQRRGQPVIESYTFHGTTKEGVDAIAKEGFRLNRSAYKLTLGPGIYSSESPDMASRYGGNSKLLLLNRICPCSRSQRLGNGSNHQIVVHTPDQILPMYILHYTV